MMLQKSLLALVLMLGLSSTVAWAIPAADNELPDLEAQDEWDEEEAQAMDEAPITRWYYDFRTSEKFCLTPEQARAKRLLPQGAMKPCKQK